MFSLAGDSIEFVLLYFADAASGAAPGAGAGQRRAVSLPSAAAHRNYTHTHTYTYEELQSHTLGTHAHPQSTSARVLRYFHVITMRNCAESRSGCTLTLTLQSNQLNSTSFNK